ncbi:MAG: hypothetical protein PHP00_03025 [Thiotrichaceae bacterium]|nr:hypothetical protein [Thiotrichaceae bacterium]
MKASESTQKNAKRTSLIMVDSQAVKNTCLASLQNKGFCFYKAPRSFTLKLWIKSNLSYRPNPHSNCVLSGLSLNNSLYFKNFKSVLYAAHAVAQPCGKKLVCRFGTNFGKIIVSFAGKSAAG